MCFKSLLRIVSQETSSVYYINYFKYYFSVYCLLFDADNSKMDFKMHFHDGKSHQLTNVKPFEVTDFIKQQWDEIHLNTNVFRYKIDTMEERILDNKYLLQLNPNRGTKRRAPEPMIDICQGFDKDKFNFTKVSQNEIMFYLKEDGEDSYHPVLVNVSPITQYHGLLCPFVDKCLPQIVTKDSLKLAINFIIMAEDRNLRLGFNSIFALASVNHLHFHIFVEKNNLPVETVKCQHLKGSLYRFDETYPVPAFCFEITKNDIKIDDIYKLLEYFLQNSIAHNIVLTRGSSFNGNNEILRLLVWPRKSNTGAKDCAAFNVAICELSGWFPVYNLQDFNNLQIDDIENELRRWKIDYFDKLCEDVKALY